MPVERAQHVVEVGLLGTQLDRLVEEHLGDNREELGLIDTRVAAQQRIVDALLQAFVLAVANFDPAFPRFGFHRGNAVGGTVGAVERVRELVVHEVVAALGMASVGEQFVPDEIDGAVFVGLAEQGEIGVALRAVDDGVLPARKPDRRRVHDDVAHVPEVVAGKTEHEQRRLPRDRDAHFVGDLEPLRRRPSFLDDEPFHRFLSLFPFRSVEILPMHDVRREHRLPCVRERPAQDLALAPGVREEAHQFASSLLTPSCSSCVLVGPKTGVLCNTPFASIK